ncbi:MAG: SGNH/GDSL hydrolase family protein [Kiritimatiellae bacterium]|nr:SGNH/GDSL hydrolase family protein [Kiritimatiellia bacterium]
MLVVASMVALAAIALPCAAATPAPHPWNGKKVVYLGDSITDPTQFERHGHKVYWSYLQEMYGIEPHVYAVSGYQWKHIYPMAQKMRNEMGDSPDAILILLGTNDFNSGVPLGEWFSVAEEDVDRRGVTIRQPRRSFVKNMGTFRGRINTVMEYLKQNFPDQQIVIMTPLHRGYANFGGSNVQPSECFPNVLGLYLEDYVKVLREAADIWGVPVIDLYRDSGLHPADPAYAKYFRDGGENGKDNLHPNGLGHQRMARTIAARLYALPPGFKE